jgi:Bacterial Ig domain
VNLFADMGVQPATLLAGLVSATASTDTVPPSSTITSPPPGTTVTAGSQVTISGTAQDFGGGVVGGVEVSVDGGATWHPAVGRENWSYVFTAATSGPLNALSRAVDDSGNLEVVNPGTETVFVSPSSVSLSANQQKQFTATVTGASSQTVSWSISAVSPASAPAGNISSSGLYTAPATITPAQVTIKATSADGTASGTATVTLSNGAVANFIGSDTSTQGSWHGVYGADGYSIANDTQSLPAYASFAVQNQLNNTWASSTSDPRALQNGSNTGRIASTWYSSSSFNFDVNFSDGNSHQFALYALDWDSTTRAESIQIVDANSGVVLDTRNISLFHNGIYLIWNLSGHVKINVTFTGGSNATISGAFFK